MQFITTPLNPVLIIQRHSQIFLIRIELIEHLLLPPSCEQYVRPHSRHMYGSSTSFRHCTHREHFEQCCVSCSSASFSSFSPAVPSFPRCYPSRLSPLAYEAMAQRVQRPHVLRQRQQQRAARQHHRQEEERALRQIVHRVRHAQSVERQPQALQALLRRQTRLRVF